MNIIIDGYNMIKQIFTKNRVLESEVRGFLNRLTQYALRKKHTIYVIFDAGPYERPTATKKGPLIQVYSGRHMSADEVIKSYIEEQVVRPMLIVTTDRQINAFAGRHRIPSIDSLDFYKLLSAAEVAPSHGSKKTAGKVHKLHEQEGSAELDVLMQEGAHMVYYKEEDQEQRTDKKNKESKEERHMRALIKKL